MISPALKNILVQFNVDGVQIFEVPIYKDEKGTASGLPNQYVLNIYGAKDALIPKLSENVEKPIIVGDTKPRPNAKWRPSNNLDVIALSSTASKGADLWRDPNLRGTLFFSDRLKRAIDAANLQTKALGRAPTRLFRPT